MRLIGALAVLAVVRVPVASAAPSSARRSRPPATAPGASSRSTRIMRRTSRSSRTTARRCRRGRRTTGATRPSPASRSRWPGGRATGSRLVRRPVGVALRSRLLADDGPGQRDADHHTEGGARLDPGLRPCVSEQRLDGDARLHDSRGAGVRRRPPGRSAAVTTPPRRTPPRRRTASSRATASGGTRFRSTTGSRTSARATSKWSASHRTFTTLQPTERAGQRTLRA